jgi:methylated-DNA-[protein]-cysteine S-methyltransferase
MPAPLPEAPANAPLPRQLFTAALPSPVGEIQLVWDEEGRVRALDFSGYDARKQLLLERHYGKGVSTTPATPPRPITAALEAYFAGDFPALVSIPFAANGTAFQMAVWRALMDIPSGQTRSYADIARAIGNPAAVRAVGLANGANPIAIIVPCHRVIGTNGSLTGYGGGLARKLQLLQLEGAILA